MTQLIRVKMETYEALQKLSGRIQTKTGKRVSLDAAIQYLLLEKPTKQSKKEADNALESNQKEPLKWFSLHHQSFKDEKKTQSSTKEEISFEEKTPKTSQKT